MCRSAPAAPRLAAAASVASQKVQSLATWSGPPGATSGAASGMVAKRIAKELHQAAAGDSAVWMHVRARACTSTRRRATSAAGAHSSRAPRRRRLPAASSRQPSACPTTTRSSLELKPPTIFFETPVYHCNVPDGGAICLDILKEKRSPALTIPKCLEAVRLLLASPASDNALCQWIAELTLTRSRTHARPVRTRAT